MGIVIVLGFFVGIILGSLSLALAERSLQRRSFMGRSCCPHCKKVLRWYDLFPVLSFILLKGKCRYCHKPIGVEYVLVEVLVGFLMAFLFSQTFFSFQFIPELIFKIFFITVLVILTITDLKKNLIPDRIIIPAIKISLISLVGFSIGQFLLLPLLSAIATAILLALFFYFLIIITKGKGMGGGDVKLVALMGLGLGFPNAVLATILGFFVGAVIALVMIIMGKKKFGETLPFGPFLVAGSLIALFWGQQIINWYLKFGS